MDNLSLDNDNEEITNQQILDQLERAGNPWHRNQRYCRIGHRSRARRASRIPQPIRGRKPDPGRLCAQAQGRNRG